MFAISKVMHLESTFGKLSTDLYSNSHGYLLTKNMKFPAQNSKKKFRKMFIASIKVLFRYILMSYKPKVDIQTP